MNKPRLIDANELIKGFCEHTNGGKQRYLIPEEIWEMVELAPTVYDIDKVVETAHIIDFFTDEEEIREVSLVLALDNKSEDDFKAFDDYLKVITERMNKKKILSHLNGDNPDKIKMLNRIIKKQE